MPMLLTLGRGVTKNLGKGADVLYGWSLRTFEDGGVFTLETYIP